jgi:hypothetical protein
LKRCVRLFGKRGGQVRRTYADDEAPPKFEHLSYTAANQGNTLGRTPRSAG